MRALQFSRDTCLTNLSFIFPLDRRCSSGFRWKLSLFRICQIGVAHIIYAYSKAAAASFVTHFIFFSSHSTVRLYPINYNIRRNTMHTYLQVFVCKDDRMRNNNKFEYSLYLYLFIAPKLTDRSYYTKITFLSCENRGFVLSDFFYEIYVPIRVIIIVYIIFPSR